MVLAKPHCGLSARRSIGTIFCGLADAALELLFALELRLLGRDEPENSNLAARQIAQRCEAAGAR